MCYGFRDDPVGLPCRGSVYLNYCQEDADEDTAMNDDAISMVQECVSRYIVHENEDGSITITIDVPRKFSDLWLIRLSEMRTTAKEIEAKVDLLLGKE
jgi:hypothetical protein